MDIFMARQPIFDAKKQVCAYELLYRKNSSNSFSGDVDGEQATLSLISDAISVFGLEKLTNGNKAFINFTKPLILEDFPLLLDPNSVVVEVLEDVEVDDEVAGKLEALKQKGYTIALDDYIGDPEFDPILGMTDIIKVDFVLADNETVKSLPGKFKWKKLLAEKIETEEDFKRAIEMGYTHFQGYFFSKPKMIQSKSVKLNLIAYSSIIAELGNDEPEYSKVAKTIESNAVLTFKFLQYANTIKFIQKERVKSVQMAIANIGLDEMRRWMMLIIAKEFCFAEQSELIKSAYIRSLFMEKIAEYTSLKDRANEVFLMGTFSLIESITGIHIEEFIDEVPLNDDVKSALTNKTENSFSKLLNFAKAFEAGNWDEVESAIHQTSVKKENITKLYLDCIVYAENIFGK